MEPGQIFVVTIIAIVSSGVTLGVIAQAWAESRKARGGGNQPLRLDAIDARLSRMEEMIETLAIEMERVAEGQRFTAKLLAGNAVPTAPPPIARSASQAEARIPTPR